MYRGLIAVLLLSPSPALADPPAPRSEVPIREVALSDGTRRYSMTPTMHRQNVDVGLDTGSTGLRVLPRRLGVAGHAAPGERVTYRLNPPQYGIQGDGLPDRGFASILGIRLKQNMVESPFIAFDIKRWIVEPPRPGQPGGRLNLNLEDAEVAAYRRIKVDADGTASGWFVGPRAQKRICGPSFFDTGALGLRVFAARPPAPWLNGTAATLVLGTGGARRSASVQIGPRDQATGMFAVAQPSARQTSLSFGLAPFFIWSVLYDADRHEIGLKPR